MKKAITILVLSILSSTATFAQTDKEYTNTLGTLFEAMGSEETYKSVIKQMMEMMRQNYGDIDAELWSELEKEMVESSMTELVDLLTPVYKKHLTLEDLKEIIAFYNTPVGMKLARSTPLITTESMQVGQEWGMKIGERVVQRITEKGY